jgi:hypothetical protein
MQVRMTYSTRRHPRNVALGHPRCFGRSPVISRSPPTADMRTDAELRRCGRKRSPGVPIAKVCSCLRLNLWVFGFFLKLNFLPANQGARSAGKALRDLTTPYRISRRFFNARRVGGSSTLRKIITQISRDFRPIWRLIATPRFLSSRYSNRFSQRPF